MNVKTFALASGSSGNCFYLESNNRKILIDCGLSFSKSQEILESKGIDIYSITDIFLTHEHGDHVAGLMGFLKNLKCNFYSTNGTLEALSLDKKLFTIVKNHDFLNIEDINILVVEKPHDGIESVSYIVQVQDKKVGFFTDLGHVTSEIIHHLKEVDLVYFEVNYCLDFIKEKGSHLNENYIHRLTSDYGHLGLHQAKEAIKDFARDGQKIILSHISENTINYSKAYNEICGIVLDCGIDADIEVSFQGEPTKDFNLLTSQDLKEERLVYN